MKDVAIRRMVLPRESQPLAINFLAGFFLLLFLLILPLHPLPGLTIKLGSLAPANSPWDNALKTLAQEWRRLSDNRINLKIYPGGIAGDEPDMLRKLRINQLQAAGLTGLGLYQIVPDLLVIQLPLFIRTEEELNYVLQRSRAYFEQQLVQAGFKMIIWTTAGWAHFFAKNPVSSPRDLMRQKLHIPAGNEREIQALRTMGFQVVPLPVPDVLVGLQSGMVEAFAGTPLTAAVFQWFGLAKNMCALPWMPLIGGVIVNTRSWDRIPDELKPRLMETAVRVEKVLRAETEGLEQEAMRIMKQHGLVINELSAEDERAWIQVVQQGSHLIAGKSFNPEIYDRIRGYLEEYRGGKAVR